MKKLKKALRQLDCEIERIKEELQRAKWRQLEGEDTEMEQMEAESAIAELQAHKSAILTALGGEPIERHTGGYRVRNRAPQIQPYLGSRDWESSSSG